MRFHATILLIALAACCARAYAGDTLPDFGLKLVARGFDHPTYVASDGSPRLYVVEQPGTIRIIENGRVAPTPFLDISDKVIFSGECGLLSVAFHPDYKKNGLFYVDYNVVRYTLGETRGHILTQIAEFHVNAAGDQADPASQRVLLEIGQPYPNHKGGQLQFGPDDGCLYVGMGDGGSVGDPEDRAQNPREFLGKILRIDVDHKTPPKQYAIPGDNPFVRDAAYRPEIWATGLRNPWRFSFDRKTHLIYAGEVGQDRWDQIDIIAKGANYGWRIKEGSHPFAESKTSPPGSKLTDPIKDYGREVGGCVIGGYVYRGSAIPALQGWYIYGDYDGSWLAGLKYEDGKVIADAAPVQRTYDWKHGQRVSHVIPQPSSFGEDAEGELYLCDYEHGGAIVKIVPK